MTCLLYYNKERNNKQTAKSEDNHFYTVWVCTETYVFKEAKLKLLHSVQHGCVYTHTFIQAIYIY